jgi:hypothetical protein
MMVCGHLAPLEKELIAAGVRITYRGKPWTERCREWVYFDCCLDRAALRVRLALPECVEDHEHWGTHDGQEAGFVCSSCDDAVMGIHPKAAKGRVFQ